MYAPDNPELFELFLKHTPTAVAMVDRQMRYLLTSRRWLTDWGSTDSELIGRSHYEMFPTLKKSEEEKGRRNEELIHPEAKIPREGGALGRWQEVQAACLAGAVERWEEECFVGALEGLRVKWEAHPWREQTGEIGGLILFSEAIGTWESGAIDFQSSVPATQERARADENSLRRQSQVLVQLSKSPTLKGSNMKAALREIASSAAATLEVSRVSVWLYSNADRRIKCVEVYDRGKGRHEEGTGLLSAGDIANCLQALEAERAIAASNALLDAKTRTFAELYLSPGETGAMLNVPIRIGGQLVGFICHEHAGTERRWLLGEINFAASIGDFAALALESCDRAKVKTALLRAKDQLQAVLDAVPGCVSWFSSDLKYLGVNGYLAQTFNMKPADFVGKPIGFLHGSPEFNNLVPDFFASPETEASQEIGVVVRGSKRYFLVVSQKYMQGQAAVFVGFDITARKQAEEALAEANEALEMRVEQRTRDLKDAIGQLQEEIERRQQIEEVRNVLEFSINRAADAVFWLTPDARFFYVNDAACLSLNYTRDELLSLTLHDINPDIPAEVWPDYWDEIKEFGSFRLESNHCNKEGQIFPVEITINYLQVNGNEYNCIFARDISDRKLVESELYQAKLAAEAANRARSSFLANMSHELRTPLTAIIGYSELLQEDVRDLGMGSTDFIPDLQAINTAGQKLLALLSNILDFSKIESGQMGLDLTSFSVAQLLEEVENTMRPQVEQDGNTLKVTCSEDVGSMYADWHKVQQILFNLLSNATKFTEHGAIALDVYREDTPDFRALSSGASPAQSEAENAERIDSWIAFRVSDTGIGISPEQIKTIFQAFTQADESTTRRYGGTGMGLALSRSLCQMMGGEIVVESELAQGSTFTVYLPACVNK